MKAHDVKRYPMLDLDFLINEQATYNNGHTFLHITLQNYNSNIGKYLMWYYTIYVPRNVDLFSGLLTSALVTLTIRMQRDFDLSCNCSSGATIHRNTQTDGYAFRGNLELSISPKDTTALPTEPCPPKNQPYLLTCKQSICCIWHCLANGLILDQKQYWIIHTVLHTAVQWHIFTPLARMLLIEEKGGA